MAFDPRRWSAGRLLASWGVYWSGLAVATLTRPAIAIWKATQTAEGHGSVSASIDNGLAHLSVIREGVTTYDASASLLAIALWVAGPPLLMWALWLASRPRSRTAEAAVAEASAASEVGTPLGRPALEAPAQPFGAEFERAAREREHARVRDRGR